MTRRVIKRMPDTASAQQLVLPIGIRSDAGFDNFFGQHAVRCTESLRRSLEDQNETLIWITGPRDAGKSHLAAACLAHLDMQGRSAFYMGLGEVEGDVSWLEYFVEDVQAPEVLILDDIQEWLNGEVQEMALFRLFNHFKISRRQLLVTANAPPARLDISLADLASRLRSGHMLTLPQPNDEDKQQVLIQVAQERGMHMPADVAAFIIRRSERNLGQLLLVLDKVERASLVEQRKLTVPFVKKVLGW